MWNQTRTTCPPSPGNTGTNWRRRTETDVHWISQGQDLNRAVPHRSSDITPSQQPREVTGHRRSRDGVGCGVLFPRRHMTVLRRGHCVGPRGHEDERADSPAGTRTHPEEAFEAPEIKERGSGFMNYSGSFPAFFLLCEECLFISCLLSFSPSRRLKTRHSFLLLIGS